MNPAHALTLEAFLLALSRLEQPLPAPLQAEIDRLSHDLATNAGKLDALVETCGYEPLITHYFQARDELRDTAEERSKFLDGSGEVGLSDRIFLDQAAAVLRSSTPEQAARHLIESAFASAAIDSIPPESTTIPPVPDAASATNGTAPAPEPEASTPAEAIPAEASSTDQPAPSKPHTKPPKIYRLVLRAGASAAERRNYHRYIETVKQTNPDWAVIPDRPRSGEAEAMAMIYQDENYDLQRAMYLMRTIFSDVCERVIYGRG